jgi:hypothetical protein
LQANQNYFIQTVANGGNDSNNGLTIGTAWATLQHAMNYIASALDIGGFAIIVNIGAGSFAGFGQRSCVGGGFVVFSGAGPASTTITEGPNDGVYNDASCWSSFVQPGATVCMDQLTLQNNTKWEINFTNSNAIFIIGNPVTNVPMAVNFAGNGGNNVLTSYGIVVNGPSYINILSGAMTITRPAAWPGHAEWLLLYRGTIVYETCTFTVPGTPNYSGAFIELFDECLITDDGGSTWTYSGVTGKHYSINGSSAVDVGGSPTYFPGDTTGTTSNGGSYY